MGRMRVRLGRRLGFAGGVAGVSGGISSTGAGSSTAASTGAGVATGTSAQVSSDSSFNTDGGGGPTGLSSISGGAAGASSRERVSNSDSAAGTDSGFWISSGICSAISAALRFPRLRAARSRSRAGLGRCCRVWARPSEEGHRLRQSGPRIRCRQNPRPDYSQFVPRSRGFREGCNRRRG